MTDKRKERTKGRKEERREKLREMEVIQFAQKGVECQRLNCAGFTGKSHTLSLSPGRKYFVVLGCEAVLPKALC